MMDFPKHPLAGSVTNKYMSNDDGTVKVPALFVSKEISEKVEQDMREYKWHSEDFLLATYPKNGTHFMWEIMTMLLRGSADYITDSKAACMIDVFPVSKSDHVFPSPRVLNTHYRLDVLPKDFRDKKTVLVLRNPKDAAVSMYYHDIKIMASAYEPIKGVAAMAFSEYLKMYLFNKDVPYGSYFDYTEYMWSLRDNPNILLIYFEDLKLNPVENIQKVNEFMGTQRSPDLIQKIADATNFSNMKQGKVANTKVNNELANQFKDVAKGDPNELSARIYRKGEIGDWKNHLTVAENEMFDELLAQWKPAKEIPFTY